MITDLKPGQRVQHPAMQGTDETAKVWRVTRHGVWVTMADGTRQQWHPEGVKVVTRNSANELSD